MSSDLILLSLFLNELGVDTSISTVADRKRVQKAVYLGQRAGVDLGYSYGWYLMGPYSSALTKDYYELAETDSTSKFNTYELAPAVKAKLTQAKSLLQKPNGVNLPLESWLELLASLDYLSKYRGCSFEDAKGVIEKEKSPLASYVDVAYAKLKEYGLAV